MFRKNGNGSRAAPARGFMALFAIMLAMGLGLMARPAVAAPFAYVPNSGSNTVSVIDTAMSPPSVVATVTVGNSPLGVAVTPDGKHAYVANFDDHTVSVIDRSTNMVVATIPAGNFPYGVAITPDGKDAYVTLGNGSVSVIDTGMKMVVATFTVGTDPYAVAFAPVGTRAYVTNRVSGTVSVIATAAIPRPWWPRSRWGVARKGSPSLRMGNTFMSRTSTPTPFR